MFIGRPYIGGSAWNFSPKNAVGRGARASIPDDAPRYARTERRVGEIEARVSFHRGVREQREREAREVEEARRKAERSGYLASLLEDEDNAWSTIDSKLQRGSGSSYDQAFRALQDLAEAYASAKRDATFRRRLVQLMAQHGKRGAWVARLTKAGYMWEPNR